MIITGGSTLSVACDEALSDGLEAGDLTLSELAIFPFTNGTAAGQCDLKWSKSSTLAFGASDTWTLSALTDGLGRSVAFARVNYFLIETGATADGDDLEVDQSVTHAMASIGGTFLVKSLGVEFKAATNTTGFVVTSGSADVLKITNMSSTNSITYRIVLIGRSV